MSAHTLPIAVPNGCTLSPDALATQQARAATLRQTASTVESSLGRLRLEFTPDVDEELLAELVETERRCCTFFDLDYDPRQRVLRISSQNHSALDAIAGFFRDTA